MLPALRSRRVIGLVVAVSAGTGIGWGAYTVGSAAGSDTVVFPRVATATDTATDTAAGIDVPGAPSTSPSTSPGEPPASALTLEEAQGVALEAAPGRVIEWDEDHEPTGLRYDVKVLHDDGTTTDVEVDTVTGQVTSIDHDTDRD